MEKKNSVDLFNPYLHRLKDTELDLKTNSVRLLEMIANIHPVPILNLNQ